MEEWHIVIKQNSNQSNKDQVSTTIYSIRSKWLNLLGGRIFWSKKIMTFSLNKTVITIYFTLIQPSTILHSLCCLSSSSLLSHSMMSMKKILLQCNRSIWYSSSFPFAMSQWNRLKWYQLICMMDFIVYQEYQNISTFPKKSSLLSFKETKDNLDLSPY